MSDPIIKCEGGSCPIKAKCQRYKPHSKAKSAPFESSFVVAPYKRTTFAAPPYARGKCDHFVNQVEEALV